MVIEGNPVFMVIIAICAQGGCFNFVMDIHMTGTVEQCLVSMMMAAKTLHTERPDLTIMGVKCIPVEET